MTEDEIRARMLELANQPPLNENAWNEVWVIQARQVVLLEQILALLQRANPPE